MRVPVQPDLSDFTPVSEQQHLNQNGLELSLQASLNLLCHISVCLATFQGRQAWHTLGNYIKGEGMTSECSITCSEIM